MISVIIPAYNAASYLRRSVESVVSKQNTNDNETEVIIVENGSTDQTTEVAEELTKEYDNVILYHSPKGVSNARNLGIEKAKGEWIAFIDADDYLTSEGLKTLTEDASDNKPDLYVYGHEAGTAPHPVTEQLQTFTEVEKCRAMMISNPTKYMQVWAKLFKKSIIDRHDLRFDTTMSLSEDSDFTLRYSRHCSSICISPVILYHYSIDNVSTMRGKSGGEKVPRFVEAMEKTYQAVEDETEEIKHAFYKYALMNLNISMVRDVYSVGSSLRKSDRTKMLKRTVGQGVFPKAIKSMGFTECLSPRMIPILAMKLGCYRGAGMVYSIRAKQNYKRENK